MPVQRPMGTVEGLPCNLFFCLWHIRRKRRRQLALDRRAAVSIGNLGAGQVGNIEHIDSPLAEGRDMGRPDVEVQPE